MAQLPMRNDSAESDPLASAAKRRSYGLGQALFGPENPVLNKPLELLRYLFSEENPPLHFAGQLADVIGRTDPGIGPTILTSAGVGPAWKRAAQVAAEDFAPRVDNSARALARDLHPTALEDLRGVADQLRGPAEPASARLRLPAQPGQVPAMTKPVEEIGPWDHLPDLEGGGGTMVELRDPASKPPGVFDTMERALTGRKQPEDLRYWAAMAREGAWEAAQARRLAAGRQSVDPLAAQLESAAAGPAKESSIDEFLRLEKERRSRADANYRTRFGEPAPLRPAAPAAAPQGLQFRVPLVGEAAAPQPGSLEAQIAALEAENARLRASTGALPAPSPGAAALPPGPDLPPRGFIGPPLPPKDLPSAWDPAAAAERLPTGGGPANDALAGAAKRRSGVRKGPGGKGKTIEEQLAPLPTPDQRPAGDTGGVRTIVPPEQRSAPTGGPRNISIAPGDPNRAGVLATIEEMDMATRAGAQGQALPGAIPLDPALQSLRKKLRRAGPAMISPSEQMWWERFTTTDPRAGTGIGQTLPAGANGPIEQNMARRELLRTPITEAELNPGAGSAAGRLQVGRPTGGPTPQDAADLMARTRGSGRAGGSAAASLGLPDHPAVEQAITGLRQLGVPDDQITKMVGEAMGAMPLTKAGQLSPGPLTAPLGEAKGAGALEQAAAARVKSAPGQTGRVTKAGGMEFTRRGKGFYEGPYGVEVKQGADGMFEASIGGQVVRGPLSAIGDAIRRMGRK